MREPGAPSEQPIEVGDRHLYPSYLGDVPGGSGRNHARYLGGNPRPLADQLPCERGLYPGYIGNTAAWNDCRRARGLPVAGESTPTARLRRTNEEQPDCFPRYRRYLGDNPNPHARALPPSPAVIHR